MSEIDIKQLLDGETPFYPQTDIHGLVNNGEYAIDDVPTIDSSNLVTSGGVASELALSAVYDVTAHNGSAQFASLQALLTDPNLDTLIPTNIRRGGMSIKFVSDNNYVKFFCTADEFTTDVTKWQGVDDVPTAGSDNLVKSNAIFKLGCNLNIFGSPCFLKTGFISSEGIIYFRDNNDYLVLVAKINPAKSYMYYHANGSGGSIFATFFDSNFVKTGNRFKVSVEEWVELTPQDIPANSEYFAMNVRYNGEDIANVIQASIVEKSSFVERLLEPVTSEKLVNGSVITEKIADESITPEKLNQSIWNKLLVVQRTENLFNELTIVDNELIRNDGSISKSNGWARTPLIPIEGGESYYITAEEWTRGRGFSWFDADKNLITGGDEVIAGLKVAPLNAAYMAFNMASTGLNYSKKVMVAKSSQPIPYDYYNKIEMGQVKGLTEALPPKPALTLTKNGNNISITNGTYTINSKLEKNYDNIYGANPVFNLENEDEIAPLHILNTTIGANHGQPCVKAFIQNHGLDNTSIGTGWQKDGITYYVMRIDDSNNITFLSANQGTLESPSFIALTVGDITNNGETLTVTSVTSAQLYPALKNHSVRIVKNSGNEIIDDGIYSSDSFDIIESYEIMNPASTLQKIIARAGQSTEPIYDGDSAIMVENTYRFTRSMTVLVIVNVLPLQNVAFNDIMFSQAMRKGDNGVVKYYVPNSLPLGNYDMRTPLTMTWNNNVTIPKIGAAQMKDPENNPVNRVIQYDMNNLEGFALGFFTDLGIGEHLVDYTNYTFELRYNTGKVYPHGVDKKIGTTLTAGTIYTAIMYRSRFVPETVGYRMSMYHFDFNGIEYVYIDYSGSMLDKVKVDDKLNGKKISVLESVNTELKTDVYNGGFYVKSTYIQNDTCYMICKIE